MEVSSGLTRDEIEAALQLIQLISSSDSRRDTTVNGKLMRIPELSKNSNTHGGASYGEFKLAGENEEDAASAAYVSSSSSPTSVKKILQTQSRSLGGRKRKLLLSGTRAQIQKETNAAQQLLQISEEEGGGESSCNISGTSYITDASSADAVEKRHDDQERESSGAKGGRGNSGAIGFSRAVEEEDSTEEGCLADIFCRRRRRRRNRKFRCLSDIYTATEPLNAAVDF